MNLESLYGLGELHGLLVTATALFILYTDHKGYQYFTGKVATLSERFVHRSHQLVWAGLLSIIATGALLFSESWQYRLSEPAFLIKMGFVAVLLMNAFAIGSLSRKASTTPFAQLDPNQKKTLLVSGGLSAMGWVGAIVIGLFFL
jgi:uncharacterized membrane protein